MSEFEFKAPEAEASPIVDEIAENKAAIAASIEEVNADPSGAAEEEAAKDPGLELEPKAVEEPDQADQEAPKAPGKHPLLSEDHDLLLFRLFNGEWILGQFLIKQSAQQNPFLEYLKVYTFQSGVNNQGQRVVSMRPWPAERGEIELNQIAAKGFVDAATGAEDGFSFEEAYVQAISPIARATAQAQQQAAAKAAQNLNAKRILTGMSR